MIDIEVLTELEAMLAGVTDLDLARTVRSMNEVQDGDYTLGVVHSLSVRRLWALAHVCDGRGVMAHMESHFMANSNEEAGERMQAMHSFTSMAKLARTLAWTQAKRDIGGAAWEADHIAIRAGWMLVGVPASPAGPLGGLLQILRQREPE